MYASEIFITLCNYFHRLTGALAKELGLAMWSILYDGQKFPLAHHLEEFLKVCKTPAWLVYFALISCADYIDTGIGCI